MKVFKNVIYSLENWDKLQYPFTRRQETDMQHDLQDGSKYRALMQPGEFLSVPEHIGLILCVMESLCLNPQVTIIKF